MSVNSVSIVLVGYVVEVWHGSLVVDILLKCAVYCAGSIAVIVDYRLVVASVRYAWGTPLGHLCAVLAVHHEVVEHVDKYVLLYVDTSALGAVAPPSCVDDGVVVCHAFGLSAACGIVLTRT